MKVLFFMPQFHQLGGAERSVIELAVELNRRGIHADILSMYSEDMAGVLEAKDRLLVSGIPAVYFLGMKVNPAPVSLFKAVCKFRKLVKQEEYTVVESSMLSPSVIAGWGMIGLGAANVIGIRCVYLSERDKSRQHRFFRLTARCNKNISYYAISNFAGNCWAGYSGVPKSRICTIYNSIPDEFFSPKQSRESFRDELGLPKDCRIAIYVGRIAAYKGIDVLLEALAPILEENNMYLLYVGSPDYDVAGTEKMLRSMEELISDNNWGEYIRFLGNRQDISMLMSASDILVHPTKTEAFGRTLAEAMAIGLPIVASDSEAVPEVLNGTDSILVSAEDVYGLRRAVLDVIFKTQLDLEKSAVKGRLRAEEFRIENRADAMIEFFKDLEVQYT